MTWRLVVVRSFLMCCLVASPCVAILLAQAGVPEAVRTPTVVPGLDNVVDAAVGEHFFLVARADGSVWSWGYNNHGQLGNGRIGAMSAADPGKTMGFVVQGRAEPIEGLTDVVGVAAGGEHALAVRRDGSVWGWGSNGSGQLALGRNRHVAVPRPEAIPGIKGAVAVAARSSSSYALLADGTVIGWGDRLWRSGNRAVASETPIPLPGVSTAVAIRAGLPSLALLRDGHVVAWGSGFLGDGNPMQQDYAAVVVPQPAQVRGVADAVTIATGASMSAVIRRDGSVWVWGNDNQGALGLGRPVAGVAPERLAPTRIPGVTNARDIAVASGSSIVGVDGTLHTWGDTRLGATGRSGIERLTSAALVPNVSPLIRVWASSY